MNALLRIALAVLTGLLTLVVSALGVSALFAPVIELSVFVGIPVGLWAGIAAGGLAFAVLWYRDQPTPRPVRPKTVLWAALAVVLDVILVFGLGTAWYFLLGGSGGLGLLIFGIPATMLVAAALGYAAAMRASGGGGGTDGNGDDADTTPQ